MRLACEASTLNIYGGPRRFLTGFLEILHEFVTKNSRLEVILIHSGNLKQWQRIFPEFEHICVKGMSPPLRLVREHILIAYYLKKLKVDVYFHPKAACCYFSNVSQISMIHDIIPLHKWSGESYLAWLYWNIQIPLAIRRAETILTVSEFSKSEIIKRFPEVRNRIHVMKYPPANMFQQTTGEKDRGFSQILKKFNINGEYILCVSTVKLRKNLKTLFDAFEFFCKICKSSELTLVIAGRFEHGSKKLLHYAKALKFSKRILFTGPVTDFELLHLYMRSLFVVYLSLKEGYGLPALEALACGKPLIASNSTSIPEICGQAAILVNPYNLTQIVESMLRLYQNKGLRKELKEKALERVKNFSWDKNLKQFLTLIKG